MNDPNGLIRVGEEFHLFYQHNPNATVWGDIHWGHATSTDLRSWTHHPIALAPDEVGQVFSGTVVCDVDNTAGFGPGALVALYTADLDGWQQQGVAVSTDGGVEWTRHRGNPVIANPERIRDFRDPKVLTHEGRWTMVLAVGPELWFYRSDDLLAWTRTSVLGIDLPGSLEIFEVPDVVFVPRADGAGGEWVLLVSLMPYHGRPGPRSIWYVEGSFDGESFEPADGGLRRFDDAQGLYAAMVWDLRDEPPIATGWLDDDVVSAGAGHVWRGRQCTPRRLTLVDDRSGRVSLRQAPIVDTSEPLKVPGLLDMRSASGCHCSLASVGDEVSLCRPEPGLPEVAVRRATASKLAVEWRGVQRAVLEVHELSDARVDLVVDHGALEVFVDHGASVLTLVLDAETLEVRRS